MSCERWQEAMVGRLYGEIEPAEDRALESHLGACGPCRAALDELRDVRVLLRDNEPQVERPPRVVFLQDRPRFRPALMAASLVGAALLAGAGAGAGYALGSRSAPPAAPVTAEKSAGSLDAATEALVKREVESRVAALLANATPASVPASAPGLTPDDLRTELAKFERKLDDKRAAEMDYMLGELEASEVRTGARIGQTNQALRYVALASNPNVTER
jgi:anti-sigma factor RsiW